MSLNASYYLSESPKVFQSLHESPELSISKSPLVSKSLVILSFYRIYRLFGLDVKETDEFVEVMEIDKEEYEIIKNGIQNSLKGFELLEKLNIDETLLAPATFGKKETRSRHLSYTLNIVEFCIYIGLTFDTQ